MKAFLAYLFPVPPSADRFRVGDRWRATNGQTYVVHPGPTREIVLLEPIGSKSERSFQCHAGQVNGLARTRWGGRP